MSDAFRRLRKQHVNVKLENVFLRDILRKLLNGTQDGLAQHYVDLEDGVIDVRVDLTQDEIAYLRELMGELQQGE